MDKKEPRCALKENRYLATRYRCGVCGKRIKDTLPGWVGGVSAIWGGLVVFVGPYLWLKWGSVIEAFVASVVLPVILVYLMQVLFAGAKCADEKTGQQSGLRGDKDRPTAQ